jgi:formylglycine-generating enzyme required for sulfatase activity
MNNWVLIAALALFLIVDCGTNPTKPAAPEAPAITSAVGGDREITITWEAVAGASSYSLYWEVGDTVAVAGGQEVTGATSPFVLTGLINGVRYAIAVTAVDSAGESGLSLPATATPGLRPGAPSITTQPQSQTVAAGQSATFNVVAAGTAPLAYQWYRNDTAISGATSSSYSIADLQTDNAGTYTVTVSNGIAPNATSSRAVLTVNAAVPTAKPWAPSGRNDLTFSGRMVLIKAAGYGLVMGSEDSLDYGASPSHIVSFTKDYYLDTTDVTQAQYQAVMGTNPSRFTGDTGRPVEQVFWYDAARYCNRRSILEGLTPCYDTTTWNCTVSATGYRLPTEAEWEYACRGGTTTGYFWGDSSDSATIGQYAWYYANSSATTHPVAQKRPNAYGLYDMSGNVWEWCNDWFGSYSAGPQTDPTGPATGSYRVLRGGSWDDGYVGYMYLRSAYRYGMDPDINDCIYGFRCVRR